MENLSTLWRMSFAGNFHFRLSASAARLIFNSAHIWKTKLTRWRRCTIANILLRSRNFSTSFPSIFVQNSSVCRPAPASRKRRFFAEGADCFLKMRDCVFGVSWKFFSTYWRFFVLVKSNLITEGYLCEFCGRKYSFKFKNFFFIHSKADLWGFVGRSLFWVT